MTRLVLVQIGLLVFQIIIYFGCEIFQKNPHNVLRKMDERIPFLPVSAIIYSTWFPLILIFPMALFLASPDLYGVYYTSMLLCMVVSCIIYVIYPTSFVRPVPPDTWDGRIMKLVYKGSFKGVNCAPSLHCSSCYLILFLTLSGSGLPLTWNLLCAVLSILIVLSTMTTKQHALIDAVSALPLAILCYLIGWMMPAASLVAWMLG